MAVTFTTKTANQTGTDGTSVTTGSFTTVTGKAYIAFIAGDRNAASPSTPTASGNNVTWVQMDTPGYDGTTARLTSFRGRCSSGTTGTVTFDFGGITHTSFMWCIVEVDGEDTSGTDASGMIQQSKTVANGTGATPTLTFDAATNSANSIIAVCARAGAANPITGPTGFTDVTGQAQTVSPTGYLRASKLENAADDTTDWSIASTPTPHAIVQYEIKVASAGGGSDVIISTLHKIGRGVVTQTAAGLGGVLEY